MALTAYLTLQIGGAKVTGSSLFRGREGQILVIGMSHEVGSDVDANGLPTGGRKHRALVVQKDLDRSSPILWQAFRDNVMFDYGFLEFTRFPPNGGQQEIHATINFKNARIVSIRSVMPNARIGDNSAIPEYEEIAFAYEVINWEWLGKDIDGANTGFTQTGCDFGDYEGHWSDALDARLEKGLAEGAQSAGLAAVEALKKVLRGGLAEPPPEQPK
ncbi:MAG: type VI secretion system tube protein Hcp [Planctomycetes bacterium]|jgi:type VI secretion system secreted protein Hcp|nr:type VI secretion system tube protein Hcp [Planctomycetota bacterium]